MESSDSVFDMGPFTEAEYCQALCLVLPEPEARQMARGMTEPTPAPPGANAAGITLTDDTLMLLSLVSRELNERVIALRNPDSSWWARRHDLQSRLGLPDV